MRFPWLIVLGALGVAAIIASRGKPLPFGATADMYRALYHLEVR